VGDPRLRSLVGALVDAFERGDVPAILASLTDDVTFSMPPHVSWCQGRDEVAESWLMPTDHPTGLRLLSTRVNGQVALGVYKLDEESNRYLPVALEVLRYRGELIAEVVSFRTPAFVSAVGLPESIPA
jgi:RNA polymerase sigma-70 factor (ECF subfamily)